MGHHSHSQHNHTTIENSRFMLPSICISTALLLFSAITLEGIPQLLVYLLAYLLAGRTILKEAVENILHGDLFDENFLMTIASIGAFCIGNYLEGTAVMLLYQLGELLQDKAVTTTRRSVRSLLAIRPDHVTLLTGETVNACDVEVGTQIVVHPGERIPLDGVILHGNAVVDTSALTGEALPREWSRGDTALAGCVNQNGVLTIEVSKPYEHSSISRIMTLVEDAQENKAKPERFITHFARIYTPIVCSAAVLIAIVPPLLGMGKWKLFIHKALSFLVISCPCALVLSVPLSFFSGIGCAGKHGILVKGGCYLEMLAKATIAAFDKTGTLTSGEFHVTDIQPVAPITRDELLSLAAQAESQSEHPLGKSIVAAYSKELDATKLTQFCEVPGLGLAVNIDGKRTLVGKREFVGKMIGASNDLTTVHISQEGRYLGYITLCDTLKATSKIAVAELKQLGFHDLTILSGDRKAPVDLLAYETGMDHAYSDLLPDDKMARLKELKKCGYVLYAGDGINDAPVLAAADVGIAMGALGSDAAIEAADVVIMSDEVSKIPIAVLIARRTLAIAKENILFSIAVKLLILTLTMVIDVDLWLAVLADVGVCILAVLNSLRTMHIRHTIPSIVP